MKILSSSILIFTLIFVIEISNGKVVSNSQIDENNDDIHYNDEFKSLIICLIRAKELVRKNILNTK